jgi:hypothetical protein
MIGAVVKQWLSAKAAISRQFRMQVSKRHIGLIAGIFAVLTSFLFVGRQHETYQLMILAGLLLSGVCFFWILFGRGTAKSKLMWAGIVAVGVVLNWVTENYFTNSSYQIYLHQFRKELDATNEILKNKSGEVWIINDSISLKNGPGLLSTEKQRLLQKKEKLGTYMILKTDSTIYYGLWGFLDVRLGLTYSIYGVQPNEQSKRLTGNWFY